MIFERSHNILHGIDFGINSISTHHSILYKDYKKGVKIERDWRKSAAWRTVPHPCPLRAWVRTLVPCLFPLLSKSRERNLKLRSFTTFIFLEPFVHFLWKEIWVFIEVWILMLKHRKCHPSVAKNVARTVVNCWMYSESTAQSQRHAPLLIQMAYREWVKGVTRFPLPLGPGLLDVSVKTWNEVER